MNTELEPHSNWRQQFELLAGLILHPLAFVCGLILLLFGLGRLQQAGWLSIDTESAGAVAEDEAVYICPMMCVEPTNAPGRCPVCGMELERQEKGDGISVRIDPATRRLLNIKTAKVTTGPLTRTIRAVGEVGYDETRLRTLSAYVDGRIEALYASYTGVVVQQGQPLAKIYSPQLYAGQVELLAARQAQANRSSNVPPAVITSTLYDSAYRRLIELGMTAQQIETLETTEAADSRLSLVAPISGTVIEKLSVDGQYVKEGDVIYRLADLSQVWLLLKLFPEDAAMIQPGQTVTAEVQSLPNRQFVGTVEFVFPNVDPETRTVNVRVVMPNPACLLRIGDFARASINVASAGVEADLADLMASESDATSPDHPLWIPRDAVLHVGQTSVAYVETERGRFEIRVLETGPIVDGNMVVWKGLQAGEVVATGANFLLDSQMQLSQQPSLINPAKATSNLTDDFEWTDEMLVAIAPLNASDREIVQQQMMCPVGKQPLGSMGTPLPVEVSGRRVFICCEGCRRPLLENPAKYLPQLPEINRTENHQP